MDFSAYKSTLPYVSKSKDPAAWKAYQEERARLDAQFRADALAEVGLTGHPKADKAFAMAYERGHSSGHSEVLYYLDDLADLLKD
jgi:hypothetical protein